MKIGKYTALLVTLVIIFGSAYTARQVETEWGSIRIQKVSIQADGFVVSGLLYIPFEANFDTPRGAVALAHGIINAKEVETGLALEVARNGYVALTVDLAGHGETGGLLSNDEPSLGLTSALRFLANLPFVDATRIAVGGHSLGAGAAREAVNNQAGIAATIFVGGGIGAIESGGYGEVNKTFPPNFLFVVGAQDILFNLDRLDEALRPGFDVDQKIVSGKLYGNFQDGSARELLIINNIHTFEPLDPATAREIVTWLDQAFYPGRAPTREPRPQTFLLREALLLVSLAAFIALVWPLSRVIVGLTPGSMGEPAKVRYRFLRERTILILWSLLGLLLYLPSLLIGFNLRFPPLLIGASMAWWSILTGLTSIVLLYILAKRRQRGSLNLKSTIRQSFRFRDIYLSSAIFVLMYMIAFALESTLGVKLKIIVPVFPQLTSVRMQVMPLFIPFFLVYFTVEGLFLHLYRERQAAGTPASNLLRTVSLKLTPYLVLMAIQYTPMFIANTRILPSSIAFFVEFLWAITPLYMISTAVSWWMYRFTGRIGAGALLNTLMFSWISAGLFPFG
jgi:dienelactone hydrolase